MGAGYKSGDWKKWSSQQPEQRRKRYQKQKEKNPHASRDCSRRYRATHPKFCEEQLEVCAQYRRKHPQVGQKHAAKYRSENRDLLTQKQRKYAKKNPSRIKTHSQSEFLPLKENCELCPDPNIHSNNLQKHHPDPNYPELYVTVCPSCHKYAEGYGIRGYLPS